MNVTEVKPQPGPQSALLACPIEDALFGGAVGGGKTYGMVLDFLDHALTNGAGAHGLFVRRVGANLSAVIALTMTIYPLFGGVYADRTGWHFKTGPAMGARLKFSHMWDIKAAILNFQGDEFTWQCVEEMGQYPTPEPIDYLKTRLRSSAGVACVFRATANPGGAGHAWIKARYISPAREGYKVLVDPRSGERRTFIPSRLEDNRILMESDPKYESRLQGLGPPSMVKALRWGDWDALHGAFFGDVWNPDKQIIKPFAIPSSWTRRRSFDWGSAKPGSLGLYAISDGTQPDDINFYIPRGSVVRFGEWYTAVIGDDGLVQPNVGLRLDNDDMGYRIAQLSANVNWNGCVADPSIFTKAGGSSIFDQLNEGAAKLKRPIVFSPADNTRIPGWQTCRKYLASSMNDDREAPGFWVFENCTEFIRTVPVLQMNRAKPDDIDSDEEDHIGDEWRYLLQSLTAAGGTGGVRRMRVRR
jgi:hypothetical protein